MNFIKTHYMPCRKFSNGNNKQKQRRLVSSEMGHAVCRPRVCRAQIRKETLGSWPFLVKAETLEMGFVVRVRNSQGKFELYRFRSHQEIKYKHEV